MSVFFKSVFPFFSKKEKKKESSNVIKGVDPNEIWELINEIGDGTFGKVHKVSFLYLAVNTLILTIILS